MGVEIIILIATTEWEATNPVNSGDQQIGLFKLMRPVGAITLRNYHPKWWFAWNVYSAFLFPFSSAVTLLHSGCLLQTESSGEMQENDLLTETETTFTWPLYWLPWREYGLSNFYLPVVPVSWQFFQCDYPIWTLQTEHLYWLYWTNPKHLHVVAQQLLLAKMQCTIVLSLSCFHAHVSNNLPLFAFFSFRLFVRLNSLNPIYRMVLSVLARLPRASSTRWDRTSILNSLDKGSCSQLRRVTQD